MPMIRVVPIAEIVVSDGRRPVHGVPELAESIREVGLLQPIVATESMVLVAGARRLAACKHLGQTEIAANIVKCTELDAELAEIDENLMRQELTVLERDRQMLRRKEIYEARHPEARSINERGGPGRGHKKTTDNLSAVSFTDDAAARLGVTPRSVRRSVQVARDITPGVQEIIRGTPLEDNQDKLLKIAKTPPARQEEVARGFLGEAKEKSESPAPRKGTKSFDEQLEMVRLYYRKHPDASIDQAVKDSGVSSRSMLLKIRQALGYARGANQKAIIEDKQIDRFILEQFGDHLRFVKRGIDQTFGPRLPSGVAPIYSALCVVFKLAKIR